MKNETTSPTKTSAMPLIPESSNAMIDRATLELLATWRREDATQNPAEVRAAEQDLAEFKKAMNENRAGSGEPLLYP